MVGREGQPSDVFAALRVPGRIEVSGSVGGNRSVDPPLGERHGQVWGSDLYGRRPGATAVDGRREITVRGIHGIGRGAGDVVALVHNVDPTIRLDHHRGAVATAGRKTGTDMDERAERLATVDRLLHDDVEVARREGAAPVGSADEGHRGALRTVVPGHVDAAIRT